MTHQNSTFLNLKWCACVHMLSHFCHVPVFATLWTVAHQAPVSMGFSREEYWSRLLCFPPGDLLNPGIKPESLMSPAWKAGSLLLAPPGKPFEMVIIAVMMIESSDLHPHLPRGITCGLLKITHTWLLSQRLCGYWSSSLRCFCESLSVVSDAL